MTLGIFLSLGDSFTDMKKSGQDARFKKFYLNYYAKNFDEVYVFTYRSEEVPGIPRNVHVVSGDTNFHRYLYGLLLPFLRYKEIKKCDVFRVFHLQGTIPAIVTRLSLGKPFIFNFAYDYFHFAMVEEKFLQAIFYKFLEPIAFFFSSKVFIAEKANLKKISKEKSVYLPNGVDTDFFKPGKTKKNKKLVVLSVGRLERQKNYFNLVEALENLEVKLKVVGSGSQEEKLKAFVKKHKVDFEIIKKVNNSQMPKIYQDADIFTLPSLIEGHPKVLLEAMSCGLPVVVTGVGGILDIVENNKNGLICKTTSDSIRECVMKLIQGKKLAKKLATRARGSIVESFELKGLLEKETKALRSL